MPSSVFVGPNTVVNNTINDIGADWTDIPYSAGIFTGEGDMTWTVEEADISALRYVVIGKTVILVVNINSTIVGGILNNALRIQVPSAITPKADGLGENVVRVASNGAIEDGFALAFSTGSIIKFFRLTGVNYEAGTAIARGEIIYEIN